MKEKEEELEYYDLNQILTKLKSWTQFEEFFQKAGKTDNLKLGLYFPDFSYSNSDFAFQVLKGEKKVNNYVNF